MKIIERIIFILVVVPAVLVMEVYLGAFIVGSIVLGLPVAAVKFIFTGRSGIEWYLDEGPMDWLLMNAPLFLWIDSMKRRHVK